MKQVTATFLIKLINQGANRYKVLSQDELRWAQEECSLPEAILDRAQKAYKWSERAKALEEILVEVERYEGNRS